MLKRFLKDSAIYGTAGVLSRAIQLLLVPLYTRVLDPDDYGAVDMMMVVAAIAMSVLTLEVAQGLSRSFGDSEAPEDRRAYASTALWFSVGSAMVLIAVAVFGGRLAPLILGTGMEGPFRVAALAIAVQVVFNLLVVQLRYDLRPGMYALAMLLFVLVSNVVAVLLVVVGDSGVIGVFWGQVVGYLVAGAIAALASRRAYRLAFDRARAVEMLAFSAPLVLSVIGNYVALLADRVAIGAYLGLWEVGVYGIGARVASTANLLLHAFAAALTPLLMARFREPETPAHFARLFRVFLLATLPLFLGLVIFADEIVRVVATEDYHGAAEVIPPLTLAVMFNGMAIFTPGMQLAKRTRLLAVIMVVAAFENVGLNAVLIPPMGVPGAAVATLISAVTAFVAYFIASQRYYRVPHRPARLLVAAAIALVAAAGGLGLARAELTLAAALAAKAAIWLAGCTALTFTLLDRHDLGIVRDRVRRLRAGRSGEASSPG